jgi:ABC-type transporter Mla subunit MlaD
MWPSQQAEDQETCTELAVALREVVARVRHDADALVRLLDGLEHLAGNLDARGDDVYDSPMRYRDAMVGTADDVANQVRGALGDLREIYDVHRY